VWSCRESHHCQSFAIAHGCDQCAGPLRHLSSPARIVVKLKDVNGFNYLDNARYHVDGYGTHVYASPNDVSGSVVRTLDEDTVALGTARPLWITEWGFQDLQAFPNKKGQTLISPLPRPVSRGDEHTAVRLKSWNSTPSVLAAGLSALRRHNSASCGPIELPVLVAPPVISASPRRTFSHEVQIAPQVASIPIAR
jgi:hypothetical protein